METHLNKFYLVIANPPPSQNSCWRHSGKVTYKTAKYKDWQNYIRYSLIEKHKFRQESTLIGTAPFQLRLKQRFKSKMKRDLDNYIKPLLDTLEGYIFDNDCQLTYLAASKDVGCEYDEFDMTFYY